MPNRVHLWLLLYAFMLASAPLYAQPHYTIHKRAITQEDGLPDRNVNCGIQDKRGYLWLGTRNGLCFYDGNQFTFLTKKSHGLRGVSIFNLTADDSVGIIIRYSESGSSIAQAQSIDVVNIRTREIKPFSAYYPQAPFGESDIDKILYARGKPVQFTLKGDQSFTWAYSHASGFQKVFLKRKPIQISISKSHKRSADQLKDLSTIMNERLTLTEDSSLFSHDANPIYVPGKGYIFSYDDPVLKNCVIYFLDFSGHLWPLDSLQKMASELTNRRVYLFSPNYNQCGGYIHPNNDGQYAAIEMFTRETVFYTAQTGFIKIFESNENIKVKSFFKDRQGAWWFCTNVGLYKLTLKKNLFERHFPRENPRFSFNNSARGIYRDDDISCFNLYDHPIIGSGGDTIMPNIEQNFAAVRVNDALWIGQHQLFKVDIKSKKITRLAASGMQEIWSIFPIHDHEFMLGCTHGLSRYNVSKNHVSPIAMAPFPPAKFVYRIFRTKAGKIMIVAENGIYFLDDQGRVNDYFSIESPHEENRLPCTGIRDVYQDEDGIYWIASSHEGLFRWDMARNNFEQFGIENGLLSTSICNIQEDHKNNLWLSTDYGLSQFNKLTRRAITYTTKDGISDNEFNRGSGFKDKRGRIYFGGMNGVTSFDPDEFKEVDSKKHDFIINTVFYINSQTGAFEDKTNQVLDERRIELDEQTKSFALQFVLLDYEDKQPRYAYKLEGLDQDWHLTNDDQIQLGNLPYDNYRLRIKAQMANGNWYDQEISIAISVPAPFYKRWWFISLVALLLVIQVVLIVGYRTRRLKNRNAQLAQIVSDRTRELELSLNEQKAMLQEIHHRVKNNLQFIEAIINMQINISKEESNQNTLQDINRRINAMTLVHEMLYNKDSLEKISIKNYITELIKKLRGIVEGKQSDFEFSDQIDDIQLDINTCMALGMITTELVSNALKYGTMAGQNPVILIQLMKANKEKTYIYKIRDKGPGLPDGNLHSGLGMRLVDIFTRQLRGKYTFRNDDGLLFTLEMTLNH
jgi:two-component sensor histidine kinase